MLKKLAMLAGIIVITSCRTTPQPDVSEFQDAENHSDLSVLPTHTCPTGSEPKSFALFPIRGDKLPKPGELTLPPYRDGRPDAIPVRVVNPDKSWGTLRLDVCLDESAEKVKLVRVITGSSILGGNRVITPTSNSSGELSIDVLFGDYTKLDMIIPIEKNVHEGGSHPSNEVLIIRGMGTVADPDSKVGVYVTMAELWKNQDGKEQVVLREFGKYVLWGALELKDPFQNTRCEDGDAEIANFKILKVSSLSSIAPGSVLQAPTL